MKTEKLPTLSMKQLSSLHITSENEFRFLNPDIGMVRSIKGISEFFNTIRILKQPYRLTEGRIARILSGNASLRINLKETTFHKGDLIVASAGTVMEIMDISDDFDICMLAFHNSFMDGWQKEDFMQDYLHKRLFVQLHLNDKDSERMSTIMNLLWEIIRDKPFAKETVRSTISMLFHQIESFCNNIPSETKASGKREDEVFNIFLELVNDKAISQRFVGFYAEKLCITPRHLSFLIKKASGRTVMDWINDAIMQEAKIKLKYSNLPVYQISDELNFPNPSFFSKFFKRQCGKSPEKYRKIH